MIVVIDYFVVVLYGFVIKVIYWILLLMIGYGYMKGFDSVS